MRLKALSEAGRMDPEYLPQWRRGGGDLIIANRAFGTILHAAICDDSGKVLYDQPVWAEPGGAIIVPRNPRGAIGLVELYRPVLNNSPLAEYPPVDLSGHGRFSLELPRGFPEEGETPEETALREAEEETGFEALNVTKIGESNFNTTYFLANTLIFLVELSDRKASPAFNDIAEHIRRVRFLDRREVFEEVSRGVIFCGATKSALMTYFARELQETI